MSVEPRPTRWELAVRDGDLTYPGGVLEALAAGDDVEGEARLADTLLPRGGLVLDAGSGMGRVGAALGSRGHQVTGVEPDPELVRLSRATYPDLRVVEVDLLGFDPAAAGAPPTYDLVVCVGNVLAYLAPDSEVLVLARIRDLLAPGGRVLAGFDLVSERRGARDYDPGDFTHDANAAGLRVEARFGSYDLRPPTGSYGVWVLSAA